jgi:hypothetical protein
MHGAHFKAQGGILNFHSGRTEFENKKEDKKKLQRTLF